MTWMASLLVVVVAGVWLAGRSWRRYQELVRAGWDRAELLRREADRARFRERARIARDMHDVLGHDLTLIALSAGALKLDPGLDERHRQAVADLRAKAGTAVQHLGEVVGLLRSPVRNGSDDTGLADSADAEQDSSSAGGAPGHGAPPAWASAERRVRRTLAAALVVPLAAGAAVGAGLTGWEVVSVSRTVLEPAQYVRLQLGQPRAELEAVLPDHQLSRPPQPGEEACEYYAMTAQPLDDRYGDAYRLCFQRDVLVSFAPVVET